MKAVGIRDTSRQPASAAHAIRIGTAGWSIPRPWSDHIAGTGTHLERYSRTLPCAEINSSFYGSHRLSTWTRWGGAVPAGFRFSVKAPRTITHESKLDCSLLAMEQLKALQIEVRTLGESLGPILFQLPPRLEYVEGRVMAFLAMLRDLRFDEIVFEPRHESWFTAKADQLLQKFAVSRAAADPAIVETASRAGGSMKLVYYRLHGSPRRYYSSYSPEFLHSLAACIRAQRAHSPVWCIFDNTASGAALGDAIALNRLLADAQD